MSEITQEDFEKLVSKFENDKTVQKLEKELNKTDIFKILKIRERETCHTELLKWLFDSKGQHSLNTKFLQGFLSSIEKEELGKKMSLAGYTVYDEYFFTDEKGKRSFTDILLVEDDGIQLDKKRSLVCIENKINAEDSDRQLERYEKVVAEQFPPHLFEQTFIFLTPDGREPENSDAENWICADYKTSVFNVLENILKDKEKLDEKTKIYLEDYMTEVKRNMNDSELTEKCDELYKVHKELFELIKQKRTQNGIMKVIIKVMEKFEITGFCNDNEKFYFRTKKMDDFLPPLKDGTEGLGGKRQGWLYSFFVEYRLDKRKLKAGLMLCFPQNGHDDFRKKIIEFCKKANNPFKKEQSKTIFAPRNCKEYDPVDFSTDEVSDEVERLVKNLLEKTDKAIKTN